MLFILALQHQRYQNTQKENQQWQAQLFKEAIQHQSNVLRNSLLKQVKQMKRQLRRQSRQIYIENENNDFINFENGLQNQNNNHHINNEDSNTIMQRNDSIEYNFHRHSHNNLNHHRRCKSKGINNFSLLEESKIEDEKLIKNENIKKCSICLDNYKIGDKILYLPCFHLYHSKCIKKWLKCSKKCPLCKEEVNI